MEELPFYSFWQEFLDDNTDKRKNLLIGIGVSGENNPAELYQFFRKKLTPDNLYKDDAYFILLIDPVYKISTENQRFSEYLERSHMSDRKTSMIPFLEKKQIPDGPTFGFVTNEDVSTNERYIKAKDTYKNYLYLWGKSLPTGYNHLEKYIQLRNDLNGPYEYGKQCAPIPQHSELYDALKSFLSQPEIQSISVYNQFVQRTPAGYIQSTTRTYGGDKFRSNHRILRESQGYDNRLTQNERLSGLPYDGFYFERMCEFLHVLWKSRKPIFILTKENESEPVSLLNEERIYQRAPNQGGRRKTKKSKRSKRSQSRRRRTIYALGFK